MSQTSSMKRFMSYKDVEYIPGTFWQKTQLYLNQKFCNVQFTAYFWYTLDVLYRKWVTYAQVLNNGSVYSMNLDDLFWPSMNSGQNRERKTTWFTDQSSWNNSKLLNFQNKNKIFNVFERFSQKQPFLKISKSSKVTFSEKFFRKIQTLKLSIFVFETLVV